jgi:hypothetical protein
VPEAIRYCSFSKSRKFRAMFISAQSEEASVVRKDAIFAVSLATLLFLGSWEQMERIPALAFYTKEFAPRSALLSALLLNVLLMATAIFVTVRTMRRIADPWVHRAGGTVLWLALYIPLRQIVVWVEPQEAHWQRVLGLLILALAAATATSLPRWAIKVATALVMVPAPLLPLLVVHALLQQQPSREAWYDRPLARLNPSPPRQRMVLVIFDSWDRYLTFEARPDSIHLPEIDRFRTTAIDVQRTTSPANWTRLSLPSLLTGHRVSAVEPKEPDQLELTFDSGERGGLGQGMNLLRRVRELGGTTALAGWYLPYCRILAEDLCDCLWEPYFRPDWHFAEDPPRLLPMALAQWRTLLLALPLARNLGQHAAEEDAHLWMHAIAQHLLSRALRVVGDPRFNLVVLHLPMPHEPGIFDRHTKEFSTSESADYLDNLVLVDQVLGQLRMAMERHGTWDSSAVLLTSDHPLRAHLSKEDDEVSRATGHKMHPYVPFLLKMPEQTNGIEWEGPLASIVTQDLILSFLRGELHEPQDGIAWLKKRKELSREETSAPAHLYAHLTQRR